MFCVAPVAPGPADSGVGIEFDPPPWGVGVGHGASFTVKPRNKTGLGCASRPCVHLAVCVHLLCHPEPQLSAGETPLSSSQAVMSRARHTVSGFSPGELLASRPLLDATCTVINEAFLTLASLSVWRPQNHRSGAMCQLSSCSVVEENQNI